MRMVRITRSVEPTDSILCSLSLLHYPDQAGRRLDCRAVEEMLMWLEPSPTKLFLQVSIPTLLLGSSEFLSNILAGAGNVTDTGVWSDMGRAETCLIVVSESPRQFVSF